MDTIRSVIILAMTIWLSLYYYTGRKCVSSNASCMNFSKSVGMNFIVYAIFIYQITYPIMKFGASGVDTYGRASYQQRKSHFSTPNSGNAAQYFGSPCEDQSISTCGTPTNLIININPLTLETNIMNSYGNSKLFEQNSTGAWCVNSDTVKLLTIVETAVKKRGAQLPIRIFLNQNIAKNNRSSVLLSGADDVPEDLYSVIRAVVDKLRLHVTSNYANVGSNYEADLLPMYTELTKACETLLAKAISLNRATTPTSTLTNTGTTSVLALHALTTAGGGGGGMSGSASTGGNASQQQSG